LVIVADSSRGLKALTIAAARIRCTARSVGRYMSKLAVPG
jgi:hypothetical protein